MRYRRLFSIEVRHDFDLTSACQDARIEPRSSHPSGLRTLHGHRLLSRARPGGIEVIVPVGDDDQPQISFATGLELGFDLRVTNPDFSLFTDLAGWTGLERPIFATVEGQLELQLGDEANPSPRALDVMAVIMIDGIAASWLDAPPKFEIAFSARNLYWVYYLVTHRAGTPSIVRPGGPDFALTELTPEQALADPSVEAAFERKSDPEPKCYRWISSQPIPCTRDPLRNLELRLALDEDPLNDEVLVSELPNPSIRHRLAPLGPGDAESLFHVVEY